VTIFEFCKIKQYCGKYLEIIVKSSDVAGVTLLQFVWIGFWFLIGVDLLGWLGVVSLAVTLVNIGSSND
jgi:hypothetical protein